jgi:hypothetical protein
MIYHIWLLAICQINVMMRWTRHNRKNFPLNYLCSNNMHKFSRIGGCGFFSLRVHVFTLLFTGFDLKNI